MKFARVVFNVAGVVGIIQLLPFYFLFNFVGQRIPPAVNHPEYYFGFVGVALAWQLVFLLIGCDPYRYRVIMLPSVAEKASWVVALVVLYFQGRVGLSTVLLTPSDFILGLLFIAAYAKTRIDTRAASQ